MAEQRLIEWAEKQHPWARDALRRHAVCAGPGLSAADKAEIVARVRHHAGVAADVAPVCDPLTKEHVGKAVGDGPRAVLCSLGPVKNLNRLAPGNQLSFAIDGITIVYGDNGSGKSGYTRVTKKICNSLASESLLGDVFKAGEKPPAEVRIRYMLDGDEQPTEVDWTDGNAPPEPVSRLSVFDSQNARFYVDRENRIAFPPKELAILQGHGAHCVEMATAFDTERKAVEKRIKTSLPGGYTPTGDIAKLIARLDPKMAPLPTDEELKNVATWTDADATELVKLDTLLANDPKALAARSRRAKSALEGYAAHLTAIDKALSQEQADQLKSLCETARITAEAASIAATDRFAAAPLKGVAQSPWRLMYDYAKAYAAAIGKGGDKLPDQIGDPCLLCQEPLSVAGAERAQSFNEFVAGTASKASDKARAGRDTAVAELRALQIPAQAQVAAALAEFSGIGAIEKKLKEDVEAYFLAAIARRDALVAAAASENFDSVPALPTALTEAVTSTAASLEVDAKRHDDAASNDNGRAVERARQAALKDRKKFSDDLQTFLARLADLREIALLKECTKAVETRAISLQITVLRRSLVMQNLEKRILDEIKALDLNHIPFTVTDHSEEGASRFGVGIDASVKTENSKVLSEGEQRALALACFLGEINATGGKNGVIIDDPVSSLDHIRIRRVAKRLVAEAQTGRQIVVFTHNILFFKEVVDAAAKVSPAIPVLLNFIRKSAAEGFGIVSQTDEPWVLMPVTKRIGALRERLMGFGNVTDFDTEEWRRTAKDFYTDLRETWERLVEEVLLYKVVERFNTDVKTQSLKGVVVEDEDYKMIFWSMKHVSERSGHDMASGKNAPTPKPTDMKTDVDEIDTFRLAVDKRRKDAAQRRKKFEEPPKATVV